MTKDVASHADSAKAAGLHYVAGNAPGISRARHGAGFTYRTASGAPVRDRATLKRIRSLVLPPAWRKVWIAADARAHLQATGVDAAGRKQYRYHPAWTAVRDATKYHRMLAFAKALPTIRRRVRRDSRKPPLSRAQVLATVVRLLERTHIRIGNEEYARTNGSHGLTTLRDRHATITGAHVQFAFRAKSGVRQTVDLDDAGLARAVRQCQELPGQTLFQYVDDQGAVRSLSSADVNTYLQEIAGDAFTAKDFRTWAGTLTAATTLDRIGPADTKTASARAVVGAIDDVARTLGNTRAVSKKCYVHPAVIEAYRSGVTLRHHAARARRHPRELSVAETLLVALLRTSRVAPVRA